MASSSASSRKSGGRKASDTPAGPARVILVFGPEVTLRDAALEEIREAVLADAPRDFNEDRFDLAASGLDPARVVAAARTRPVMASLRLVVARGISDRRAGRFIEHELPGYLDDPSPTTCLVLEGERIDRRQRWVKHVQQVGQLRECKGPSRPAELRAWIEARLRQQGKKPARGAAAALLDLVGPDLDRLSMELDKACLYAGERPEVNADDIAAMTGDLRPRAVYELTDAIGGRQRPEALKILSHLIDQGDAPLAVLGALANHFRRLLRTCECRPLEPREVQRRLSVHPYTAQKLVEQARHFGIRRLRVCLDAVRRTDEALKGSLPLPARLAIERLVLAVCG